MSFSINQGMYLVSPKLKEFWDQNNNRELSFILILLNQWAIIQGCFVWSETTRFCIRILIYSYLDFIGTGYDLLMKPLALT